MDMVLKGLKHKQDILEEILEWYWREPARSEIELKLVQVKHCLGEYSEKHLVAK